MNEWHRIADGLPPEGVLVIGWTGDGYRVCKARRDRGSRWGDLFKRQAPLRLFNAENIFEARDVTHWMRFPEPPGEKE